jgi:hypothetical protein
MLCHVITIWGGPLKLAGVVARPFLNGIEVRKLQKFQQINGYMADTLNMWKTHEIPWVTCDIPYLSPLFDTKTGATSLPVTWQPDNERQQ